MSVPCNYETPSDQKTHIGKFVTIYRNDGLEAAMKYDAKVTVEHAVYGAGAAIAVATAPIWIPMVILGMDFLIEDTLDYIGL